ncbi:MAG TPA: aquaporin [Acidimicrobiales bacterium]|nr:aquaporin [Acidimicrobiales bacterium]
MTESNRAVRITGTAPDGRTVSLRALLAIEPPWVSDFDNLAHEWRRLFCELFGTFLLILAGAGPTVVNAYIPGSVPHTLAVVSPALMVMAIILSLGSISGAHLNPVVSVAFALRREFPWRRVPGYIVVQLGGAALGCLVLRALFGRLAFLGATLPAPRVSDPKAFVLEAILTLGLVTVILGTASGAQNVGPLSALAVSGYITLAGIWGSPITGASMNPARSFGPDAVLGTFDHYWVYSLGPLVGAAAAVGLALVLRGRGGDVKAAVAAQGTLGEVVMQVPQARLPAAPPTNDDERNVP